MSTFIYRELAWAWIIIVGGLMIIPGEIIVCIACGPVLTKIIGLISIAIGIAGFVIGRNQASVGR